MDEPCSALDPIATAKVEELIDELREHYTIAIVTHNMQQAARVSQFTAFFHLGELVEFEATEQIFTNPTRPADAGLHHRTLRLGDGAGRAQGERPMAAEHTVKAYDEELDRMNNAILEMGGIVEQQLAASIAALVRRDDDLASRVITEDRRVDALEAEIDQLAVRILALRQPVAVDLRVITASLKVASDLERMGDYAANVAKRSIAIQEIDPIRLTHAISRMAGIAQGMIKDVLDSFRDRDVERAMAVWRRDEDVDESYNSLFRELLTYMMEDPRRITPCAHLLVHRKEHRANRRPRDQHRRDRELRGNRHTRWRRSAPRAMSRPSTRLMTSRRRQASMKPYILIVEDEAALLTLLRYNLEKGGYEVGEAIDGEEALLMVEERRPDLMVLDWMLPTLSGIEVCRRIRRKTGPASPLPIVMLTARGEEADRVRGLDGGADDYVVKPFSPAELLARIRAILRRMRPALGDETLRYGDLSMDLAAHKVTRGDAPIHLGPTEFRLLRHLMEHPGRVFSREQLLDSVWGPDIFIESRTVDVHVRRLRQALNADRRPDLIRTVRSAGYALDSSVG